MTNHPNRSKKTPREGRNPLPVEIIAARAQTGLTRKEAAGLVYKGEDAWRSWEEGRRRMPPDTWELFNIKIGNLAKPVVDNSSVQKS